MSQAVDFKHIRNLSSEKPKTKAALVRWLWPDIKRALEMGHTVREVRETLRKDGININYSNLRYYVAQLKHTSEFSRKDSSRSRSRESQAVIHLESARPADSLRVQRSKKIKFDHDPFSANKNNLI